MLTQSLVSPQGLTSKPHWEFNYELFNCNNFNIRYWSWSYRGCWHQTCPPIDTCKSIWAELIPITTTQMVAVLLLFVSTSLCREWVSNAPAAFLGCSSHLSGSLSGIEPRFPVTRYSHGRPLSYRLADRSDISKTCRWHKVVRSVTLSRVNNSIRFEPYWFCSNKAIEHTRWRYKWQVLALEMLQLSVYNLYHVVNDSWFNEPFAVSLFLHVNIDMHGLIIETSIWLLAGSTRYNQMLP